jgi:ABC-2 type transport system permease protein
MGRALHAEWTKLRTLPSTGWLLLAMVAATVAVTGLATASLDADRCQPRCAEDVRLLAVYGVRLGQVVVVVLAVLAVSNEYATRMVQTTLLALPRRLVLAAAKVSAVVASTLVVGAVAVAGSLLVAARTLPAAGFTTRNGYPVLSLADDTTVRVAVGSVLYLGLVAALSAGVALVVRDTAVAVTVVLGTLFAGPIATMFLTDQRWVHRLHRWSPSDAGLAVQATKPFTHTDVGPWQGLGVLTAYAAATLVLGVFLFRFRDA